jgi:hypothetical protein
LRRWRKKRFWSLSSRFTMLSDWASVASVVPWSWPNHGSQLTGGPAVHCSSVASSEVGGVMRPPPLNSSVSHPYTANVRITLGSIQMVMPARSSEEFSTHRGILSNALDFLLHSLRPPVADSEEEPGDILPKYLVLNLAAAVELIFKARLCKAHWSLIFQKLDKVSREALQAGDFCSVTFDDCVERLTRICGISFSASVREVLRKRRSQRNIYQHLRFETPPQAKLLFAAQCLDLVLDHLETWFDPDDLMILTKMPTRHETLCGPAFRTSMNSVT